MENDLFNKATKYYFEGNYKEALSIYYEILSQNLDNYSAYYNIGLTYDVMGEIELAIAYYNKAIKINSKDIRSINNLAKIYYEQCHQETIACELLDRAIEINPMDAEAYNMYGNICFNLKDYKKAKLYFQKSINFDKNYFKNYYDMAKTYLELGEKDKAREYLNTCVELNPDFEPAKKLL